MTDALSSSNNALLRNIGNNTALENAYGAEKNEKLNTLLQLYSAVSDNNVSDTQKKALLARAEVLKANLDVLESKMGKIDEDIEEKQEKIKAQAQNITKLVSQVKDKSTELNKKSQEAIDEAIEDTFKSYSNGEIDKDSLSGKITSNVKNALLALGTDKSEIEKILGKFQEQKTEIDFMVESAKTWADDLNILKSQYSVDKTSYNFINKSIERLANSTSSYSNSNYNKDYPVYSVSQLEVMSGFLNNPEINLPATNSDYNSDAVPPVKLNEAGLKDKYGDLLGADNFNDATSNLYKALDQGLLNDLAASGLNKSQVSKFLANNFSNAGLTLTDGKLTLSENSRIDNQTFAKIKDLADNKGMKFLGADNNWSAQGNRIDSNAKISSLNENFDEVFNTLVEGNNFSFKEAMTFLFGPEGLFKGSGISYNPSVLDSKGNPTYSIQNAGDSQTAQLYQNIANTINSKFGINPTSSEDVSKNIANTAVEKNTVSHYAFNQGNSEFALISDKNADGAFSGANELVQSGADLKNLADENGIISGDNLKSIKFLKTDFASGNNVNYSFTNAQEFGATSIQLNDDGSFTMSLQDGNQITIGKQETSAQIYEGAKDNGFEIGFSQDEIASEFNANEAEVDALEEKFNSLSEDIKTINDASSYSAIANDAYKASQNKTNAYSSIKETQAQQKASKMTSSQTSSASSTTSSKNEIKAAWNSVWSKIEELGKKYSVSIDETTAKKMFENDATLDADSIFNQCVALKEEEAKQESQKADSVWDGAVYCLKHNVQASKADIEEAVNSGASTGKEIADYITKKQENLKAQQEDENKATV